MLARHCADARYVWNLGLEQRDLYRPGRAQKVTANSQMRELAEARQCFTWLAEGSSSIQQQALKDLDQAFQNWWKNAGHFGRPTWRRASQHEGFRIVEVKTRRLNRKWAQVQIPKAGWVRFRLTRSWCNMASCRSARVTLNRAGQWHVTFVSAQPAFRRSATTEVVGLDLGVATSIATSNGELLKMPSLLNPGEAQRKRRLER
jgi:putative transposase